MLQFQLVFLEKVYTLADIGEPYGECEIPCNIFIFCCYKISSGNRRFCKCYSRGVKEFFHLLVAAAYKSG